MAHETRSVESNVRILLIKMSSMGDVFHTFPALSDALAAIPDLSVDWVVEKSFADIPAWHPVVDKVYGIELRKWRKTLWKKNTRACIKTFFERVNQTQYDLVLDAQGLLKSAWVARKIAKKQSVPIAGYNWQSAREPLATLCYQKKYAVGKNQHAILRLRQLFAQALSYSLESHQPIQYGLNTTYWNKPDVLIENLGQADYAVFLHGTTWDTKYWPEANWRELLARVNRAGLKVVLPWGNEDERLRALRIADTAEPENTWVPAKPLTLNTVAHLLSFAKNVVSVDTGLSHVAAALEVPMVVLYRVTDPKLVGAAGEKVVRLESPCAPDYLKQFPNQETEARSLNGLSVTDVYRHLDGLSEPKI
ncbi:MAG: lipopolysaccharide heptosyltransferase I [Thiomicrorhabdus sp.]|nr:lipopolysaccharide heptosyltransferase I [Thiomicrorhabdus sp.]